MPWLMPFLPSPITCNCTNINNSRSGMLCVLAQIFLIVLAQCPKDSYGECRSLVRHWQNRRSVNTFSTCLGCQTGQQRRWPPYLIRSPGTLLGVCLHIASNTWCSVVARPWGGQENWIVCIHLNWCALVTCRMGSLFNKDCSVMWMASFLSHYELLMQAWCAPVACTLQDMTHDSPCLRPSSMWITMRQQMPRWSTLWCLPSGMGYPNSSQVCGNICQTSYLRTLVSKDHLHLIELSNDSLTPSNSYDECFPCLTVCERCRGMWGGLAIPSVKHSSLFDLCWKM